MTEGNNLLEQNKNFKREKFNYKNGELETNHSENFTQREKKVKDESDTHKPLLVE